MHRSEYMGDDGLSETRHNQYYLQFATSDTYKFVFAKVGTKKLLSSRDHYFNDIIENGESDWIWSRAPINTNILAAHGEIDSEVTRTCVAKAVATHIKTEKSQQQHS